MAKKQKDEAEAAASPFDQARENKFLQDTIDRRVKQRKNEPIPMPHVGEWMEEFLFG